MLVARVAEDQPDAGRLGLHHRQLGIGRLRTGPGGQSMRPDSDGGLLDLQGAAQRAPR